MHSIKINTKPKWEFAFFPPFGTAGIYLIGAFTDKPPPLRIMIFAWLSGGYCRRITKEG